MITCVRGKEDGVELLIRIRFMKMKITTWAAAILFIVAGCRQKTTEDGTMVDRETGYTEEQLDNRGGQAQSQDSTGNELFDTAEGIRTGSRRMKKTLVPRALVTISANK